MSEQLTFDFYKPVKYKPTDLAYIAGLIDGEGCIRIFKGNCYKGRYKNKHRIQYGPDITIRMCDIESINFMKSLFGGNIHSLIRTAENPLYANQFSLTYSAHKIVMEILLLIRPYLKVKRKQADYVIEYIKNRAKEFSIGRASPYGDYAERIYQQVKQLNRRGPK